MASLLETQWPALQECNNVMIVQRGCHLSLEYRAATPLRRLVSVDAPLLLLLCGEQAL